MDILNFLDENMLWVTIGAIAVFGALSSAVTSMYSTAKRERSRREIAAYIAEGSMTPEQGERLMHAGRDD